MLPFTEVPTGTVLGVTSFDVLFDPAPLVEAGQQYAIVVQSPLVPAGAGHATGIWGGSTSAGYAGGSLVIADDEASWAADCYDVFFRTCVGVPEPAALTPVALALALLRRR